MKEVVVISGKGGTGKTSLTSSFSFLGGKSLVIGDCDVDADDMHLLLKPDYKESKSFFSGFIAEIDSTKCLNCGICFEKCRFKAISKQEGVFKINGIDCEGCGYCKRICSADAITIKDAEVGSVYKSNIKTGAVMVHARLKPGADNSGKLVAQVKKDARDVANKFGKDLILIDGSPGIGCPVVSSLTGANYVILVTEPTPSGYHDLKRVYEVVKKFKIKAGLIINKSDLNQKIASELEKYANSESINLIGKLSYDEDFSKAITNGITAAEYQEGNIQKEVKKLWETAKKYIYTDKENI
ncbi:MAG: ATP-binding protein [Spirochaetales bacterium]|nr:ATP-binding protein [Spirochaetales bacterium]